MNKPFPTCETCVYLGERRIYKILGETKFFHECEQGNKPAISIGDFLHIEQPDRFFCSEHEAPDGERFVNWPKINLSKTENEK